MRTQKMKNRIIVCFMTMLGLASCSDTDKESDGYTPLDKQAATSDNLIAALMDGLRDKWSVGDTILLLHDGHTAFAEARNAGNISGFSSEVESSFAEDGFLFGVCPAGCMVSSGNGNITVTIPSGQTAGSNGYDEKAAVSVARTASDSLCFYTVCGGIKLNFQMPGVTKVELESVDGYALSGTVRLKWDEQGIPVVDEMSDTGYILTFNAPDESGFAPGRDYYISTLPCDLYGGYRLSIYKNGLVADYFGVHQTVERASYITPDDLVENELEFDNPDAPLVEEERPELDATTTALLRQYRQNPTEGNKQALLEQMGLRYDKVVARKKSKLRELEREAKTPDLVEEMQEIVDEMVDNRDIRLEQQFLRLIDPRTDDNPNDVWLVLHGVPEQNAYIGYAPVTNAEYAVFDPGFKYDTGTENYPAVNITVAGATAYCDWLTLQDDTHIYRLPTDEEWILAAGHMPKDVAMNSGHVESGLTAVDAYSQTTGACGGIDFWGNCWEWTSSTNTDGLYVIKGGSWDSDRDDCRSEKSDVVRDGARSYSNVGFRVVRTDSNI